MIQLHYHPGNASMIAHIVLEEIGVPFELLLVDRATEAQKSTAYLKLNPNGLIPVLRDGDMVLYETAAICLHLADTHPQANLAPPLGSPERAHFYKWLVWLTNTLQPTLFMYFYPERYLLPGNTTGAQELKQQAEARVAPMLAQLDAELARVQAQQPASGDASSTPWFMGTHYTLLDAYVLVMCRWSRYFTTKPARDFPHIGPYLQRMLTRPAVQRVLAKEGLAAPLV